MAWAVVSTTMSLNLSFTFTRFTVDVIVSKFLRFEVRLYHRLCLPCEVGSDIIKVYAITNLAQARPNLLNANA